MDHEEPDIVAAEKPSWFKSPLASDRLRRASEAQPHRESPKDALLWANSDDQVGYDGYPPFKRYEEPTLLEIFYDLFFAANYNVFAQSQEVTNHQRFKSYVGYFSLLWGTWLVVTLYDVRYVTDSIFERVARAVQLGVLIGFTIVAPNFNPEDQDQSTMMTLCINVLSAAVYFGITFRFQNKQSRVYITWYILTAAEAVVSIVISNFWKTLSFTRTHLMKRLSLITVMILGESIQTVAQNIATIVQTPAAWNPYTIGMITSATATIYCVFLVYFDWMRHLQLPPLRQQIWTALHYPFHLSLVLFMRGFTQLILFVKAFNVVTTVLNIWAPDVDVPDAVASDFNVTSRAVADQLLNQTNMVFELYPPKSDSVVRAVVNHSIANISMIPDNTWPDIQQWLLNFNDTTDLNDTTLNEFTIFIDQLFTIISSLTNSVFTLFDIDVSKDVQLKHPGDNSNPILLAENQIKISDKTRQRARLVFAYTYIACGCTLVLLVMMALVSRMTPVGRLPRLRFVICTLLGIGLALAAVIFFNPDEADNFLDSPWPIPAILLGWLVVTILVHIRGSGRARVLDTARSIMSLFRPRKGDKKVLSQDENADSQQVVLQFWPPTRENTDLSAAETLQGSGNAAPRHERRVSFRDVSPKG
ncbi:Low temperature requirement A [Cordyceps javanica]|uniref:Low temperature requirement A n=1 Tax=Cordyceps javanica TaxID=43265 RepID=A0A545WDV5_9HYPO|nr:Low temperature requirement A [Cordyceps javanica]TQW12025.1 Low temperature requirement A [Cordyceps javanica]